MSKDFDNIIKQIAKSNQEIHRVDNHLSKDISEIKKAIKSLDNKMSILIDKIQELEIIMDAAEILEEFQQEEQEKYNTEWNPYQEYEAEDYDNYESDPESEDE
jgi:peptidoglycan hydrolase CwlO-like protein